MQDVMQNEAAGWLPMPLREAAGCGRKGGKQQAVAGSGRQRQGAAGSGAGAVPPPQRYRPGRRRSQHSKTKGWGYSRPQGCASDDMSRHSDSSQSGNEVSPS